MATLESLTLFRLDQLRRSVKGYRELERAAAEFRGRAALGLAARILTAQRQARAAALALAPAAPLNRHTADGLLRHFAREADRSKVIAN